MIVKFRDIDGRRCCVKVHLLASVIECISVNSTTDGISRVRETFPDWRGVKVAPWQVMVSTGTSYVVNRKCAARIMRAMDAWSRLEGDEWKSR